ncbi:MAG TPA: hypothetical protein VHD56_14145 [Tepidisphaeraceae bacterium]|nr:hypothetical protein [Tepidisphaeraceae bacterium]
MPRGSFIAVLSAVLLVAGPVFGQTSRPSYPDTVEGLTQFFKDMLAATAAKDQNRVYAYAQMLTLPKYKEFFKKTFGDEVSTRLIPEYEKGTENFPLKFTRLFLQLKTPKELTPVVTRVEGADDVNATIYQRLALEAMVDPVPLYSVTISKPGASGTIQLWSLVYIDGAFRLVGKMQAIRVAGS